MRPNESFVGQPIRSLQTMLRTLSQDDEGLPYVIPDGIYGPATASAISAFQRREGLPITGIADQRTWDSIVENYEPALIRVEKAAPIQIVLDPGEVLRSGDTGPYILLLQSLLASLAADHATLQSPGFSGILDPETEESIRSFQRLSDLPVTGELDKITWKRLVRHYSLNASLKNARFR